MADFEKIEVFDSRNIVHQKVEKVKDTNLPKELEGKIYGITLTLNNCDKVYFELTEDDWIHFIAHNAWHNGYIYIAYIDNHEDKFFTSYEDVKNFIKDK